MSTKKVKDGVSRHYPVSTTKTRKPTEATKKETPKTSSRVPSKRVEDDEDKIKKPVLKSRLSHNERVSKPAPTRKNTTAKPPSRPVTPPSSRVTKTQFFPSKKMYSVALKKDSNRKTNPKKVPIPKIALNTVDDASSDTSSVSERPRTATLRKGSIVNKNIVGPDMPRIKVPVESPQPEYEDDFDSYESDFEACSSSDSTTIHSGAISSSTDSTESEADTKSTAKRVSSAGTDDEKKLDSGNYELPESRHRQILDNIKESIEKENANLGLDNRSNLGSLSDEGFEEGKSMQFINFLGAQRKYQHRKSVEMRRKRGEEILSMIRLDHYSFTLFDLAPVPYDVFIKSFGKSNTIQASVQTGEDDVDEEAQTEMISYSNKWTQYPPCFIKPEENEHFWDSYKCNYLGVGGDSVHREKQDRVNDTNLEKLEKFLLTTGNLILDLQAEASIQTSAQTDKTNIPFSKGFILYKTQSVEILKNRSLNDVSFCLNNSNKILTVHGTQDNNEKSVICLWNVSNVEEPEMVFFAFGEVVCCSFSPECPSVIFGGLKSGAIAIWDMTENSKCHKNVYSENHNLTRSPTYFTGINYGHRCKVISIQPVATTSENDLFSLHRASEVCSLDEDGDIIVWSVIFKEKNQSTVVENQGLAHWGSVILTINNKISLQKLYPDFGDFICTDLTLSQFDSNNLYISTNHGIIIHCLATGGKPSVKKFLPEKQSQANCLEMCPFSCEYFLAGFDNGDTSLYSRVVERPLMVLSNRDTVESKSKIERIQWSHNRPLMFYTKDVANNIHVWNLKVSDMFPVFSVPFKDKIISMKLSTTSHNDGALEKTYMIIATDNGSIYIHLLDDGHDQQSFEEFDKDKKRFLNYVNRYL